jgi:hypothetical protein
MFALSAFVFPKKDHTAERKAVLACAKFNKEVVLLLGRG